MSDESVIEPVEGEPAPATPDAPIVSDWKSGLPEEIAADPALQDIKDVEGLAKSMIHAQKLVGMDRGQLVTVPGTDASEEEWNEFYTKAGRPESADAYRFNNPEGAPEPNEEMQKWYADTAFKAGLTASQAAKMYEEYQSYAGNAISQMETNNEQGREEGESQLKKEWGAAYEARVKAAVQPIANYADDGFSEFLETSGMGNDPNMIKFLYNVSKALGEDTVSDVSKNTALLSPAEATAQIAQKQNDPAFMEAYMKGDHPSHAWAVQEMTKLHQYQFAG